MNKMVCCFSFLVLLAFASNAARCNETDSGRDLFKVGTTAYGLVAATDYCVNSSFVHEYYCDVDGQGTFADERCLDKYECVEGQCIIIVRKYCEENDAGFDVANSGTLNYWEVEEEYGTTRNQKNVHDECLNSSRILEYYCTSNNTIKNQTVDCPEKTVCEANACVTKTLRCVDSDGENVETQGEVVLEYEEQAFYGTPTKYVDYCISETRVSEYACGDENRKVETKIDCPQDYTCYEGACIRNQNAQPAPVNESIREDVTETNNKENETSKVQQGKIKEENAQAQGSLNESAKTERVEEGIAIDENTLVIAGMAAIGIALLAGAILFLKHKG